MRARWQWLFGCSIVSLTGVAWLIAKLGAPASMWASVELIGMILCAGIALYAAITDFPRKWPAVVALLCAAPLAQNILLSFPSTMQLLIYIGVSYAMFLVGSIGAVVSAISILARKPPLPPTDDIVARARVVR